MSLDVVPQSVIGGMSLALRIGGTIYQVDPSPPFDISIPLDFHGRQPGAFHLPEATAASAEGGGFIGDTRRGGSCNCETVTLNPHGNGTHTECVGHITDARIAVSSLLRQAFIPAVVLSVRPEHAADPQSEGGIHSSDLAVTRAVLQAGLARLGTLPGEFFQGLVLRTLPNDTAKTHAAYSGGNPPYITPSAMHLVRELGVEHLLLDLPSADREDDGGGLVAHRIFWDVPPGIREARKPYTSRTITEMIYVEDAISDGIYLLNLQIPPFLLDAAPSRPLLFRVDVA